MCPGPRSQLLDPPAEGPKVHPCWRPQTAATYHCLSQVRHWPACSAGSSCTLYCFTETASVHGSQLHLFSVLNFGVYTAQQLPSSQPAMGSAVWLLVLQQDLWSGPEQPLCYLALHIAFLLLHSLSGHAGLLRAQCAPALLFPVVVCIYLIIGGFYPTLDHSVPR